MQFENTNTLIVQESRGMQPRRRQKRVHVDAQAHLKYMCDAREAGTKSVEELLDGVGHLIRFLDCRFNCIQLRTILNCIVIINWCSEMRWMTRLK